MINVLKQNVIFINAVRSSTLIKYQNDQNSIYMEREQDSQEHPHYIRLVHSTSTYVTNHSHNITTIVYLNLKNKIRTFFRNDSHKTISIAFKTVFTCLSVNIKTGELLRPSAACRERVYTICMLFFAVRFLCRCCRRSSTTFNANTKLNLFTLSLWQRKYNNNIYENKYKIK